jgi:hypothetical protein
MQTLFFGVALHCKRSSYKDLVSCKSSYDTKLLHTFQGKVTGDHLNSFHRRIRTLDHVIEVETLESKQEDAITKELKESRSIIRRWMAFSGTLALGSLGVALLGPGVCSTYAYFGMGTSSILFAWSGYRHWQFSGELEAWNTYFEKHQDLRREIPSMSLNKIKASNLVSHYLTREEGENLWVNQVDETYKNLGVHITDYNATKVRVIQHLIQQQLLECDLVTYFNHVKLTSETLAKLVANQSARYRQLVNEYEKYKKSYESEKEVTERLYTLEREKNKMEHDSTKAMIRTSRNLHEAVKPPEQSSFWSTLETNTVTDVATDVVETSKRKAEVELVKKHAIREATIRTHYEENVAQLYSPFLNVFHETAKICKDAV